MCWSSFKVEEINDLLYCDRVSYLGEFSVQLSTEGSLWVLKPNSLSDV